VIGAGPAYIAAVPAGWNGSAATMLIDEQYRDAQGWVGQKSPWLIAPGYRGAALIRGARIDARGGMRLAVGSNQRLKGLRLAAGSGVQPSGWRVQPASAYVRRPGCYAYQIDGTTFSEHVVIRVAVQASGGGN
jgi:hypothetical protein